MLSWDLPKTSGHPLINCLRQRGSRAFHVTCLAWPCHSDRLSSIVDNNRWQSIAFGDKIECCLQSRLFFLEREREKRDLGRVWSQVIHICRVYWFSDIDFYWLFTSGVFLQIKGHSKLTWRFLCSQEKLPCSDWQHGQNYFNTRLQAQKGLESFCFTSVAWRRQGSPDMAFWWNMWSERHHPPRKFH